MYFNSQFKTLEPLASFEEDIIKNEPMFFSASPAFALQNGGPITKQFLKQLPWKNDDGTMVFDSRVHMLMPGWYPCIPGWHHDDVPRTRSDGQPNYNEGKSQHIMAIVNGGICPTYFAVGNGHLPEIPLGKVIYKEWHPLVELLIKNNILTVCECPSNYMVQFNYQSFHRGSAAIRSGWRWFGRVTRNSTRKVTNEIRKQVQIYMSEENAGW